MLLLKFVLKQIETVCGAMDLLLLKSVRHLPQIYVSLLPFGNMTLRMYEELYSTKTNAR